MYSSGNTDSRVQRTLDFQSPPHSNPASPREALIGVGLLFVIQANSGNVFVHSIVPDSPAERCGCINVGDALVSIDARPISSNTSLAELRSRVLGPHFSTVTLGFSRRMIEHESDSHSSVRFSVFLTRAISQSASSDRGKEALFSEGTLASKSSEIRTSSTHESSYEFQPRPPPARSLNSSLSANGSISSTSPKQRFSVVGKRMLEEKFPGGALEFNEQEVVSRATPSEQLYQSTANSLQRLMENISQQPDQDFSGSALMQTTENSRDFYNDVLSGNATDYSSIQRLSKEVQAVDSWLRAKDTAIEEAEMLRSTIHTLNSNQNELAGELIELSQLADHLKGQHPNNNHDRVTIAGFGSTEMNPTYGISDQTHADKLANGVLQSQATSLSPIHTIQGFSRRPLSESEVEFLSYENREVCDAESRISHAIANSKAHNYTSVAAGIGCLESDAIISFEKSSTNSTLASRDASINASTSPSKVSKIVRFDQDGANVLRPSSNVSSIYDSASYSYIVSLASSVQALDESLNDERKLLLISQHQHHSSVAKIAELERTVEHLRAQFQRSETVNQRIMERTQVLEATLHTWSLQKMTQDSELHSNQQLIAELNQQNIRLSNDLHSTFEQRFLQQSESPKLWLREISKQIVEATMLLKDIPALEYLWRRAHGQASALLLDIHEFSTSQTFQANTDGGSILL